MKDGPGSRRGRLSRFRVQIRLTGDVANGFERSLNMADSEEVSAFVDAWLRGVLAG